MSCLEYEGETGEGVIWLFVKIYLSTAISMERSRRELSIDMVNHRDILKNTQITLLFFFTFMPKPRVIFIV